MIDPTKPGPTADRIAWLKREIASCDWHINEIQADPLGVDQMALGGAIATRDRLRAELARLRNEPSPASSPGPQDAREALKIIVAALEQAQDCILGETPEDISHEEAREDTCNKIREAMFDSIPAVRAALAQSDAEPREPDDTKVICPNCTHCFTAISVADQARFRAAARVEPNEEGE